MAKRTLENLQKQYNSSAASDSRKGPPMPGPGGRRGGPGGPRGMGGKPKGDAKKVVARLLSYIGAYKYLLVLAFVFLILSTLAGTAASYLLRPIVNAMGRARRAHWTSGLPMWSEWSSCCSLSTVCRS